MIKMRSSVNLKTAEALGIEGAVRADEVIE
jgi:hypothetical protein